MPTPAPALALSAGQKAELDALIRNGNTPQKVALRCRLLLLAHQGVANQSIAEQLNLSRPTILALRAAFAKDGMAAVTGIRRRTRKGKVQLAPPFCCSDSFYENPKRADAATRIVA